MNQAGKELAQDMNPDHTIEVDINLSAKVEGHIFLVDAKLLFDIELNAVLQNDSAQMGDISALLDGLNVDLGDDTDAVMEQLGQPRIVGVVKEIKTNKLQISNASGNVDTQLNKDGTLLVTLKDDKLLINFESTLSFLDVPDAYVAIPSMEKMQNNIQIDINQINRKVKFAWTESDKDNLKVSGSIQINKI